MPTRRSVFIALTSIGLPAAPTTRLIAAERVAVSPKAPYVSSAADAYRLRGIEAINRMTKLMKAA